MTPQILACDEILPNELPALFRIASGGIKLFCTMHGSTDLFEQEGFERLSAVFKRFVLLSAKNAPGELVGVFDEKQKKLL